MLACDKKYTGMHSDYADYFSKCQILFAIVKTKKIRLHSAKGCVLKCGCIGLMLFHNLSCLGTIIFIYLLHLFTQGKPKQSTLIFIGALHTFHIVGWFSENVHQSVT